MGRRNAWLALALSLAGLSIGVGWRWWQGHRLRRAIGEIEAEMAAGRHAVAARDLMGLLKSDPGCDQAAYLLGTCERARGRIEQAERAWASVPPGSAFSSRAISERLTLLVETGRLAAAEDVVNDAALARPKDRSALRILLVPTFTQQGRLDDALRLIEERWRDLHKTGEEASELAVNLGRLALELRWNPAPIDTIRATLDRASALAPKDDRVWLGQANLAILTGSLDTAAHLLDQCLDRRPEDSSVWWARLQWAMAANRVDAARVAIAHLPAHIATPAQVFRVDAWLAARQGDGRSERQALERLIAADPADRVALKRLAELARQNDGPPNRADNIRGRQAEIGRLSERFRRLYDRNQPIRDGLEMGQLAAALGDTFIARVFLTVAAEKSLHRDEASRALQALAARSAVSGRPGQTLADVIITKPGQGGSGAFSAR
jgi:thioredoxin-like negative regulator of GroEL